MKFSNDFKYIIQKNKNIEKSTCEKLQSLSTERQLDKIHKLLNNNCVCLQCREDEYLVVDKYHEEDVTVYTCNCSVCMDCLMIEIDRNTHEIKNVYDIKDI